MVRERLRMKQMKLARVPILYNIGRDRVRLPVDIVARHRGQKGPHKRPND